MTTTEITPNGMGDWNLLLSRDSQRVFLSHLFLDGFAVIVVTDHSCNAYPMMARDPGRLADRVEAVPLNFEATEIAIAIQRVFPEFPCSDSD